MYTIHSFRIRLRSNRVAGVFFDIEHVLTWLAVPRGETPRSCVRPQVLSPRKQIASCDVAHIFSSGSLVGLVLGRNNSRRRRDCVLVGGWVGG